MVLPRFALDTCGSTPLHFQAGCAQTLHVVDVVQERGEPLFPIVLCCLTYSFERAKRTFRALCPELRSGEFPLARFPSPLASAAGSPALFGDFDGTLELSDFVAFTLPPRHRLP